MGGTQYKAIMERAAHLPVVQDYMSGTIDQSTFRQELTRSRDQLAALGVSDGWLGLLARVPNDPWQGARRLKEVLFTSGIAQSRMEDEQAYLDYEHQVIQHFSHLPDRYTSIFPEETRIAYALSCAIKPASIFVAGSYYGYLAVWLIPGLAADGQMVCSDVNPAVCELACQNMVTLGKSSQVSVQCVDAEKLLKSQTAPIDLFVLDAYGGYDHPDPQYHGKAIYSPLLKAALPRLHNKSIILVHNAERDSEDLNEFFKIVDRARFSLYLNTTENMAVFQL